ncbi:Gfo/Idh/MocA family oxidoreductase [Meiothermus rufus]|uniref:Gfo/Idh/MocA family oxidoreductase n=1 Tax=Meiothermus rufus TaxID=604332 RepID=UPI0004040F1F|nr:Gfo/Idh/MocA family oxidoreductase [Meiothermus rufus]
MKNFAMTGVAGYIAPRHLKAIKDTGNTLVAALDPFDSVGIMDSYFPEAEFFTQPELFEQYLYDLKGTDKQVDYVSIATPNYLHASHIHMALRAGADAICEKPLVLNPEEILRLKDLEAETGRRVWTVLQLRTHEALLKLKQQLEGQSPKVRTIDLTYVTSRGTWYHRSWKGKVEQSGGLATNIGVHFFDMLVWLFGRVQHLEVHRRDDTVVAGYLELEWARVRWFLSIDVNYVPLSLREQGRRTFRSMLLDGQEIEFSEGFTELHTRVYERTLAGQGFGLDDTYEAIAAVAKIRTLPVVDNQMTKHPFLLREVIR